MSYCPDTPVNCQPETAILPFKDVWWNKFLDKIIKWDTQKPGLQIDSLQFSGGEFEAEVSVPYN